jgi:hypothetical protein
MRMNQHFLDHRAHGPQQQVHRPDKRWTWVTGGGASAASAIGMPAYEYVFGGGCATSAIGMPLYPYTFAVPGGG